VAHVGRAVSLSKGEHRWREIQRVGDIVLASELEEYVLLLEAANSEE
jgi:hypothetical protein